MTALAFLVMSAVPVSRLRFGQLAGRYASPVLLGAIAMGLTLLTVGNLSAANRFQALQHRLDRDIQLQQLGTAISHDTDMLSMSARAAVNGELAWQGRYEVYESLLVELIEKGNFLTVSLVESDDTALLFSTLKHRRSR